MKQRTMQGLPCTRMFSKRYTQHLYATLVCLSEYKQLFIVFSEIFVQNVHDPTRAGFVVQSFVMFENFTPIEIFSKFLSL
jgi:hypothetical protein